MKTLQATFLSLLITSIASSMAQNVNIIPGIDITKCVEANGPGSAFQIQKCDDSFAWRVSLPHQSGDIKLANSDDRCITAKSLTTPGIVTIDACNDSPAQQWNYTSQNSLVTIRLSHSDNFCLNRLDSDPDIQFDVQLSTDECNDDSTPGQFWQVRGPTNS